jgi:hypothetical protein
MQYLLDADWAINALAGKRGADAVLYRLFKIIFPIFRKYAKIVS